MPLQPHHKTAAIRLIVLTGSFLMLIFLLFSLTQGKVKDNEAAYLRASLSQVLPDGITLSDFDNAVIAERQTIGQNIVYPACKDHQWRYALVEITTDKGYSGNIRLLVSINIVAQRLIAVRPLFHQETPGLGDQIDVDKSDWLKQFAQPLDTATQQIAIKRDGGKLDAITGATITSRAISNAVAEQIFSTNWRLSHNPCGDTHGAP